MSTSLRDLENELDNASSVLNSGRGSLRNIEAEIDQASQQSVRQIPSTTLKDVESELDYLTDPVDFFAQKFRKISNAPHETIRRTTELFKTGHPILGTLTALDYPVSNILEAVNQFAGIPLERQLGIPKDITNAVVEIFGPAGLARQSVKAGFKSVANKQLKPVSSVVTDDILEDTVSQTSKFHRSRPNQVGRDFLDFWYRGAATYLDELGEFSPTAANLRRMIKNPTVSQVLAGPDYMEGVRLAQGKFELRLADLLEAKENKITLISGKLPDDLNDAVVSLLRDSTTPIPKNVNAEVVRSLANKSRLLLGDIAIYAKQAGVSLKTITNYFPRRYVLPDDKIEGFQDLLASYGNTQQRIENIVGDIKSGNGFPLASRTLNDIPDNELAPYLDNDFSKILYKYIGTITHTAEFSRRFGRPGDLALTKEIIKKEATTNGYNVPKDQLNKEINRIDNLISVFKNKYHPINTELWKSVNNKLSTYQYLRTLNYATLSNLSEAFWNLYYTKPSYLVKTIPAAVDHIFRQSVRSVVKDFPKAQITREFENIAGVLDKHQEDILKELFGTSSRVGDIGFKVTGLTQLTNFNKVISARLGELYITDRADILAKNIKKHGDDYLQSTPGKRILGELKQFGVDGKILADDLLETGNLDAHKDAIKAGKLRYVDQVVFYPQAGNRPIRFSDPKLKFLHGLSSFPVLFANHVFPRIHSDIIKKFKSDPGGSVKNAYKAAQAASIMAGVAYLGMNIKGVAKYGVEKWDEMQSKKSSSDKIFEAFNQAGWFGQMSPLTFAHFGTKYGEDPITSLLGPNVGQASDLATGISRSIRAESLNPLVEPGLEAIPILSTTPQLEEPLENMIRTDR